jgi:zeaxanthin glucosyltransferase
MKLGFICPNVPGHLNPMTALGRQLQARNHEVVFLYSSGAGGLPFVPGPEKDHVKENISEMSKNQGDNAVEFGLRILLAQTEAILKSLPATVTATGVDALVLDSNSILRRIGCDAVRHAVHTCVARPVL